MSVADISILVVLVLSIGALVSTVGVLYTRLKVAISSIVITDEDGKVRGVKVFEIIKIVISAVTAAEETGKKGAEKKEIALATIQATLDAMNAEYDIKELSGTIDTLVSLINAFIKKKSNKK